MLAKLTSKNQLTLPKAVVSRIEATEYFEVTVDDGRIVLTPVWPVQTRVVRDKLKQLGISEEGIADAVAIIRAQDAFAGTAKDFRVSDAEEVQSLVDEVRYGADKRR